MTDSSPCSRCGAQVGAGARFCSVCGSAVSPSGEVAEDQLLSRLRQATLGEYDVLRELGRGGMAAVYLAWDRELARYVAIKVLLPELAHQATMSQRFLQEARTAANLDDHPSVVRVYRAKESQGLRYFVMKYVDGCSLDLLLRATGPLPVDLAAHVVDQVALALQYAHDHGVVHRDVKPGNVLLDRAGGVVVTDFGIAKIAEGDQLTRTGFAIGTPHYMSPEQWRVEPLTPAADQYALGVVAYHLLTGATPFDGTQYEIQEHHLRSEPPPLAGRRPEVPPALDAVVGRMLAKRADERFLDLRSVSQALATIPRDPPPLLRERLYRLIPAALPPTARATASASGPASAPAGFLRPVPFTPGTPATPVSPPTPTAAWQQGSAGYAPPSEPRAPPLGVPSGAPSGAPSGVPSAPPPAPALASARAPAAPAGDTPAAALRASPTSRASYAPPSYAPPVGDPVMAEPSSTAPAGAADALPAHPRAAASPPEPLSATAALPSASPVLDPSADTAAAPVAHEGAGVRDEESTHDVLPLATSTDLPPPARPRHRQLALVLAAGSLVVAVAVGGLLMQRREVAPSLPPATIAPTDRAVAASPPGSQAPATAAGDTERATADSGAIAASDTMLIADGLASDTAQAVARDTTAFIPVSLIINGRARNAPITLAQGDSVRLAANVMNARRQRIQRAGVAWESSDPARVVFRRPWAVAVGGAGGPVTVTATSGRLRSAVQISVAPRASVVAQGPAVVTLAPPTDAEVRAAVDEFVAALRGRNFDELARRMGERAGDGSPTREFLDWARSARGFGVERPITGRVGGDGPVRSVAFRTQLRHTRGGLIKTTGWADAVFNITLRHGPDGWRAGSVQLARRVTP